MALVLHLHPLSSFCHKVLIALYENATPFTSHVVDFSSKASHAALLALWQGGKIPVLHDAGRDRTIPESSIIIEYLDEYYPGARPLLPADRTARLDVRLWDRFCDLHVHIPMQRIVGDLLRASGEHDPRGVEQARATITNAYDMLEQRLSGRMWLVGDGFTLADCAATPALFYAGIMVPLPATHANLAAYFERLIARPSVARVLAEAKPWFAHFPARERIPARFTA